MGTFKLMANAISAHNIVTLKDCLQGLGSGWCKQERREELATSAISHQMKVTKPPIDEVGDKVTWCAPQEVG